MEGNMYGHTMWGGHWLWMLVFAIVAIIPAWRICQRIGYPGALGVLIVIPLVNLFLLYFLAFSEWPANRSGKSGE
ncbi:MAG: hypothetical protein CML18_08405 [Pusillimonas sp.]|jgi:hypothetical protein|nr:hypothetical protein [Pusillimonas sp.]